MEKFEKNNFFNSAAGRAAKPSFFFPPAGRPEGKRKNCSTHLEKEKNAFFEKSKQFFENLSYTKVR